jgi:uncharacterized protein
MRVVRATEGRIAPWKNGLGSSRIIASDPVATADSETNHFDTLSWHVSLPEVTGSSDFSTLAGLDRQWMLLEGPGIELHCNSTPASVDFSRAITQPLDALAFRGEWSTKCRLIGGTVKALSVLTRRGQVGARIKTLTLTGTESVEKAADERTVILVVSGQVRVLGNGIAVNPQLVRHDALVGDTASHESYSLSPAGWDAATVVIVTIDIE